MQGFEGWIFRAPVPWDCESFPLVGFPLCPGFVYDKFYFIAYLIKRNGHICSCLSHAVIIRVSESKLRMCVCLGEPSCGPNAACDPSTFVVRHANYSKSTKKLVWNWTNHCSVCTHTKHYSVTCCTLDSATYFSYQNIKKEIPSHREVIIALFSFPAYRFWTVNYNRG
jgi:hypothetical protein